VTDGAGKLQLCATHGLRCGVKKAVVVGDFYDGDGLGLAVLGAIDDALADADTMSSGSYFFRASLMVIEQSFRDVKKLALQLLNDGVLLIC
jgi:hypothetical protein